MVGAALRHAHPLARADRLRARAWARAAAAAAAADVGEQLHHLGRLVQLNLGWRVGLVRAHPVRAKYILEKSVCFVSRSDVTSMWRCSTVPVRLFLQPDFSCAHQFGHSFSSVCSANIGVSTVCPSMLRALTLLACSLATGVAERGGDHTSIGGCEVVGFCVRSPDYGLKYRTQEQLMPALAGRVLKRDG